MPTAPGYADVSVGITLTGMTRVAYITFGVDPTATDPVTVNTSVMAAIQSAGSLVSMIDSGAIITRLRVSLGTDGAEDLVSDVGYSVSGGKSATSLPPNCALLVHKRTARGGRRGRGRLFIPWAVAETDVDEAGIITAPVVTTAQTASNAFLTALGVNNVPMAVLHSPGQTAEGAPNLVTGLTVDRLISTQRRRLGR